MPCHIILLAQLVNTGSRLGDLALAVLLLLLPAIFLAWGFLLLRRMWRARIPRLRKLPQTDEEKLDAVELTLKGGVLFVLGLLFFPLIVISLVPLYYGLRKLAAIRLGMAGAGEDNLD